MEIAKIVVNATTGHCISRKRIPAGIVGATVLVKFCDPIWDKLNKTVIFRGTDSKIAEFDGQTAIVPWEVLKQPGTLLCFGIWGSDPDSDLQLPLIEVDIGVIEAATDPNADPGTDPELPIWAQLQQDIEALKKGGASDEQIAKAVEAYLDENPIETPDLTDQVNRAEMAVADAEAAATAAEDAKRVAINAQSSAIGSFSQAQNHAKKAEAAAETAETAANNAESANASAQSALSGAMGAVSDASDYASQAQSSASLAGSNSAVAKMHADNASTSATKAEDAATRAEAAATRAEDAVASIPESGGGTVKSVNGVEPDENGNVEITIPDSGGNAENGEDGFSPIATVEQTDEGAVISITDANGTTTATITNGKDGADGAKGDKGDPGEKGEQGEQGIPGENGPQGEPGKDGSNGADGKDGTSATHSWNGTTLTITSASGTSSADLKGAKGDKGDKGDTGEQGIQGIQGEPGAKGDKGDKGDTGEQGIQGIQGVQGDPGNDGADGVGIASIEQTTTSTADGGNNVFTVALTNGNKATFTVKNGSKGSTGAKGDDGADYVLTDADKTEIAETVKAEVPLVKVAEQPTFVNSVDEMTDTSKVYVMSDMSMWAWMKGTATARTFTADDFRYSENNSDGSLLNGYTRISTTNLIDLSAGTVSVECPSPYQYFVYYYTENDTDSYIGKTAWKTGSIDDVLTDTVNSGTMSGAKYCRISLRDSTATSASLNGRMDEFMQNVLVTQKSGSVDSWSNTGYSYNQPADYEDRIVALENALEGIEYGSF